MSKRDLPKLQLLQFFWINKNESFLTQNQIKFILFAKETNKIILIDLFGEVIVFSFEAQSEERFSLLDYGVELIEEVSHVPQKNFLFVKSKNLLSVFNLNEFRSQKLLVFQQTVLDRYFKMHLLGQGKFLTLVNYSQIHTQLFSKDLMKINY